MTAPLSSARLDAALERHAASGRAVQVAAVLDGELIVDATSTPEGKQTVFPVFSVGKAIVALAVHLQALRGLLDLDAPVARYWPAYGSNGKQGITISQVLSHRAGVPQAPPNLMPDHIDDREWLTRWLEEVTPLYEPGTTNAYLPLTFGWILGEVVRRTDPAARTIDMFVREELCEPLGADAFWFGIPAWNRAARRTTHVPGRAARAACRRRDSGRQPGAARPRSVQPPRGTSSRPARGRGDRRRRITGAAVRDLCWARGSWRAALRE